MKRTIIVAIALAIVTQCYSQSELPKYASSKDAVLKKVKLDMPLEGRKYKNGTGYSLNPKLLKEMPKKVALVAFYSFDPGMTKTQMWITDGGTPGLGGDMTLHTKTTKLNSKGSSGDLALGVYNKSIDNLTNTFKSYGMDLLLPQEYLNTDEKKEYYNSYKVERAKFNEWISSMGSGRHNEIYGYPDGYNVIDVVNEPYQNYEKSGGQFIARSKGKVADNQVWVMDKCGKMVESLGGLCAKLEVDAIVVVYFTIFSPKENKVKLQNVNMHMFGPNPTPLPEGKTKKFNYFNGKFYCGTRINPEVLIWNKNKKKPETDKLDFTGYDIVFQAMAEKMGTYLKEGIEKGK